MTFDPAPYAQEVKKLKLELKLKEVAVKREELIRKLEHLETFEQSIAQLPEVDLSGPFGISIKDIIMHKNE